MPAVLVQRDGQVGVITLNRPDVLNAMNAQLRGELDQAVAELEEDDAINALVLTGAGRAFCAGNDIHEAVRREERQEQPAPEATPYAPTASSRLAFCAKPTIAAINGLSVGGGAMLASAADIRLGCTESQFRFMGAAYGRINATWTLATILGMPMAKELLFSGRPVEAQEARSIGLLNRLVPLERLMEETMELAHLIAGNPPDMIQAVKKLLHDYIGMGYPEMLRLEQETRYERLTTPPASETFREFLGRNPDSA